MDWLRGKKRGGAEVTLARPGSKGSARDPLDVAVEGMGEDAASVPQKTGDEVDIWQEIPEMGVGSTQPAIFAVEEEDTSSDGFAKAGMSKNISRTAMAGNLFDTIDKSGDGNVSKDELTAILENIGFAKERTWAIFDAIDVDGSGEISRDEFIQYFAVGKNEELFRKMKYAGIKTKVPKNVPVLKTGTAGPARCSQTALALQEVWELHDEDRDGWLTEQQLYDALRSVGIRLRKKEKHELRRELEDELELWSDSNDSPAPSDVSVDSDIDADETVYEDHANIVRVLQNGPRDSIERLVVNEKGKPEWTAVLEGTDRLDRDKPEHIANWVAATCKPGLSLADTKDQIIARTTFYKKVHELQTALESNSLATQRLRFTRAWTDRSLQRSEGEEALRNWLKEARTSAYWKDRITRSFMNVIFRFKKADLDDALDTSQELMSRGRQTLKKSSVEIQPRNVLERVNQAFADELIHKDDDERRFRYETAFQEIIRREECESLGVRGIMRAMRTFGATVNSAEVFEMMEEIQAVMPGEMVHDFFVDIEDFCNLAEHLFQSIVAAASKDKVIIFIQEASDLPVMDRFGAADAFVTSEILGRPDEDRRKTFTRKNSLNPAWNTDMTIYDVSLREALLVSLWDDEVSGFGATLIGEFTLSLSDVVERGVSSNSTTHIIEEWFELMDENGKDVIGKFGGATKIRAKVSYVCGSLTELKQKPMGPQNIDFSLVHIKIKSAQHLPKMDKGANGSVDPYCIISYFDHRIRTLTCMQNYSPVWDEEYVLVADVPEGSEIVVTMFDYDEEGRDDSIGSCKVFVSPLDNEMKEQVYDLRTLEENSLIISKDGHRAAIRIEASLITNEEMRESKSILEIMFAGLASDNHATVLACCSAMWQLLQHDQDKCEREALHILNQWQTMTDILLTGVVEINVHGATDLPRMDYFGLCDPYVTVTLDGYMAKTEIKKMTLDPVWDQNLRVPTWLTPLKPSAPAADKPIIMVRIYDWDKAGEHDLVGSVLIPLEDWLTRGPERADWDVVGEPEKIRSLRPGEPDQVIRKPVIGNSGRPSKLQMTVEYNRRVVVMDEAMEEMCWAIAFAVQDHEENAQAFGLTLGGVGGLTSILRKAVPEGTGGEKIQAACFALANLAAAHRPNQKIIMENNGIERLLDLATVDMPPGVQRAACIALSAVVGDNPECIACLLEHHKNNPEKETLIQRAGGIGILLVLLRDVRPDVNFKATTHGAQDGWGEVALLYEACIKTVAAASFVNTKGLWFTNATSIFSKADKRATVRQVAIAMGLSGLRIIRDISYLPIDSKQARETHAKRATKETIRYANLSYQALDAAYAS